MISLNSWQLVAMVPPLLLLEGFFSGSEIALLAADKSAAAELRRNVTSPGGTTEAALSILMDKDGLARLMARAVAAAAARARELSA